jgi:GNAT superfamily N-acetyltransferase
MIIRQATIKDAYAIAHVHVTSWHETYTGIIPDSYLAQLDVSQKQEMWTKALERNQPISIAEMDGKIAGFANAAKNRDKESPYPGELYTIYALKSIHGRGVGRKLFEATKSNLEKDFLFPFVTFVLADNPTLGFYKHMGAEVIGEYIEDFDGTKLKELQLLWK